MASFLTDVKSARDRNESDPAKSLLTAVTSTPARGKTAAHDPPTPATKDVPTHGDAIISRPGASPEDALRILRSNPSLDQLTTILHQLNRHGFPSARLNLHAAGPLQAQIINTLLTVSLHDFWAVFTVNQRTDFVACLQNVAGLNAVFARLKLLTTQPPRSLLPVTDLLQLAQQLLTGKQVLFQIWRGLQGDTPDDVKRRMTWKQLSSLLASGKVISTAAQAEDATKSTARAHFWIANGGEYAAWFGCNIASMLILESGSDTVSAAAQMMGPALSLGYSNKLLRGLFEALLQSEQDLPPQSSQVPRLLLELPVHVNRTLTEQTLRWLSYVGDENDERRMQQKTATATAFIISTFIAEKTAQQHIASCLVDPALSTTLSFAVRRACVAVVSSLDDQSQLYQLLEKLFATFSDRLFINHAPVAQQESIVQTLLLASGYLHRNNPVAYLVIGRSSHGVQGVSNRLDSSNSRARWLGMVVATAVSRLVDKESSRMNFGTDEMHTEDALWYLSLVAIADRIGTLQDFAAWLKSYDEEPRLPTASFRDHKAVEAQLVNGKPVFGPPRPPVQTEVIGDKVTEVFDDESTDGQDFKPYAKPDSDVEDSDEEATLVNRSKTRPPVYIRDLMSMLRDDKDRDRFQLGIKHAAPLIRRKLGYGTEVKDHAEELAGILCNLQDPFDTEEFDELKLQALITVLLADVTVMAPWLSKQAFAGEYSIAQRCTVLSALGLAGRELGGFTNEDGLNPNRKNTQFSSKKLPQRFHLLYRGYPAPTKRLDAASTEMERALVQPLALQAADQSTSHLNALKVRTFSSRVDVERTKRKPAQNRLAKVLGESFFLPLASRYQQDLASYGSASPFASSPVVLVTFLKTLALLLHASGPATAELPRITADFWDLLLSLRVQALTDISILQAVLFSLLTMLELNTDKQRIAEELPRQLMESQRWVDIIFERTGGGALVAERDGDEEAKVRTLAAGVLVKINEIVE